MINKKTIEKLARQHDFELDIIANPILAYARFRECSTNYSTQYTIHRFMEQNSVDEYKMFLTEVISMTYSHFIINMGLPEKIFKFIWDYLCEDLNIIVNNKLKNHKEDFFTFFYIFFPKYSELCGALFKNVSTVNKENRVFLTVPSTLSYSEFPVEYKMVYLTF